VRMERSTPIECEGEVGIWIVSVSRTRAVAKRKTT
jgi:hypothetical protein